MKIVAAVYSHPEYYPPTLNALDELSKHAAHISLLARNVRTTDWNYPSNIELKLSGRAQPIRDSEQASYHRKIFSFLKFSLDFYILLKQNRPAWVICYDPIPLLSFRLVRLLLTAPPKLWYHNHDVLEPKKIRKYSITWFASVSERRFFQAINLFTLPSEERKAFFQMDRLTGTYLLLPNYPSRKSSRVPPPLWRPLSPLKLLYQGHIGEGHGLLEIIRALKKHPFCFRVSLSIIGIADPNYKEKLENLIEELDMHQIVTILKPLDYRLLFDFTRQHHIGLAIHESLDINFRTAGTASNKIYEYAACGLPIILYDSEEYRNCLSKQTWAFFTNLSAENIWKQIEDIHSNYQKLSRAAWMDFQETFNFEIASAHTINHVLNHKTV